MSIWTWLKDLFYTTETTKRGIHLETLEDTLALRFEGVTSSDILEIARKCKEVEGLGLTLTSLHAKMLIFRKLPVHNREAQLQAIWRVVLPYLGEEDEDTE